MQFKDICQEIKHLFLMSTGFTTSMSDHNLGLKSAVTTAQVNLTQLPADHREDTTGAG